MFFKLLMGLFIYSLDSHAYYKMHTKIVNNDYKICILGDTGTGKKKHKLMGKLLAQENCDQVRILGDVIYPKGLSDENDKAYFEKFYIPFKPVINSKKRPLFHIITGNHDYKKDEYVWIRLHNKYHYLFSPGLNFIETYEKGKVCFFNLDTTAFEYFQVKKAYNTYNWLNKQIEGHKSCELKFAFGHHPFKSSGQHGDAHGLTKFFLKHSVMGKMDAYFAGHDHHLSYEGKYKGTELFISGAFSKLRPLKENALYGESKNGYIVMNINKSDKAYQVDIKYKTLESTQMKTSFEYSFDKTY